MLTVGFDRIHRSNQIGTFIPSPRFTSGTPPVTLELQAGDKLKVDGSADTPSPRGKVPAPVMHLNDTITPINATSAVEPCLEWALLRSGRVNPLIVQKGLAAQQA